jgi:hypothetical protein
VDDVRQRTAEELSKEKEAAEKVLREKVEMEKVLSALTEEQDALENEAKALRTANGEKDGKLDILQRRVAAQETELAALRRVLNRPAPGKVEQIYERASAELSAVKADLFKRPGENTPAPKPISLPSMPTAFPTPRPPISPRAAAAVVISNEEAPLGMDAPLPRELRPTSPGSPLPSTLRATVPGIPAPLVAATAPELNAFPRPTSPGFPRPPGMALPRSPSASVLPPVPPPEPTTVPSGRTPKPVPARTPPPPVVVAAPAPPPPELPAEPTTRPDALAAEEDFSIDE